MTPSQQLYGAMQTAFDHFNKTLFEDKLPPVIFTTQRQKNVMGYLSLNRWISTDGVHCHEIAINPAYVGQSSLIELMQTLSHECVHLFQELYGAPGRKNYHNKEWADMMESIGLMPSATGRPGGAKTGQSMSDYPIPGGRFIDECEVLVSGGYGFPWIDRLSMRQSDDFDDMNNELAALGLNNESVIKLTSKIESLIGEKLLSEPVKLPKGRTKSCYSCPSCKMKVWGKPDLELSCTKCDKALQEN
jgi:predicted SprT family Zn-dependent metalloprotease